MKEIFGMNLSEILKSAVSEAVDAAIGSDEKSMQKKTADALKPFKAPSKSKTSPETGGYDVDEGEDEEGPGEDKSLQEPVQPRKDELPEITITTVVDLIGSIRAGQSLKEKQVLQDLKVYFDRLNGNERVALYAFLTGLSKVMANVEDKDLAGSEVETPKSEPFKIKMKKDSPPKDFKPAKGEESPIVVGESADKSRELSIMRRLK